MNDVTTSLRVQESDGDDGRVLSAVGSDRPTRTELDSPLSPWRRRLRIIVPLAILAAAVLAFVLLQLLRPEVVRIPAEERTWNVAVAEARFGDEQPILNLFGEIVAGREVVLRPLVAGPIVEVGADFVEGGIVASGDLLVAVDPFDFQAELAERTARLNEAEGRLAELEAELQGARAMLVHDEELVRLRQRDVGRRQTLRSSGSGSVKALDDAQLGLNEQRQRLADRTRSAAVYDARIRQQSAIVEQLRTRVDRALRDLERARLTAPFAGFLTDVEAELGQRVSTGDRVARLIDVGRLEARFHLSTRQLAEILGTESYRGREIIVAWGPEDAEIVLAGRIDRVEGESETASGGVDLYARLEGIGPELGMRPGASCGWMCRDGSTPRWRACRSRRCMATIGFTRSWTDAWRSGGSRWRRGAATRSWCAARSRPASRS